MHLTMLCGLGPILLRSTFVRWAASNASRPSWPNPGKCRFSDPREPLNTSSTGASRFDWLYLFNRASTISLFSVSPAMLTFAFRAIATSWTFSEYISCSLMDELNVSSGAAAGVAPGDTPASASASAIWRPTRQSPAPARAPYQVLCLPPAFRGGP